MKRQLFIALAAAGGAALIAVVAVTALGSDPHKTPTISVDEARQVVRDVVDRDAQVRYDGVKERPGIAVYVFSSPEFQAYVDVSDGHISLLTYAKEVTEAKVVLDSDQAEKAALEYLSSIGSPTDGMRVSVAEGTGGGYPGYTVYLDRTINGVELPDYRVVEIDGVDGSVISLVDVRRPVMQPREATISSDDAIAAVSGYLHDEHVDGVHQTITFDASGQQLQVWEVSIVPDDPAIAARVLYVDAFSGAVSDPRK